MPDVTPGHPTLNPGETKKIAGGNNGGAVLTNPRGVPGAGGVTAQASSFEYVATGLEGGNQFTVPIPLAKRPTGAYVATAQGIGPLSGGQTTFDTANLLIAQLDVIMGYTPQAGDTIGIIIVPQ